MQEYVVGPLSSLPNGPAYTVPGLNSTAAAVNSSQPSAANSAGGSAGGNGPSGGGGTGPLKRDANVPVGSSGLLAELNYPYNKGKGYQRVYDQDVAEIAAWTYSVAASIQDLTLLLFNGVSIVNHIQATC